MLAGELQRIAVPDFFPLTSYYPAILTNRATSFPLGTRLIILRPRKGKRPEVATSADKLTFESSSFRIGAERTITSCHESLFFLPTPFLFLLFHRLASGAVITETGFEIRVPANGRRHPSTGSRRNRIDVPPFAFVFLGPLVILSPRCRDRK